MSRTAVVCAVVVLWSGPAVAADPGFTDVTATALPGVADAPGQVATPPGYTGGAAVGDCDGDGLPDVYLTGAAHDVLYRNRGDGTFEDVTVAAGLGRAAAVRGAAFGDVDDDGDVDLYVTSAVDGRHFLYVNDGRCRFTEEAASRGVAGATRAIGRSVSFGDYDRDGWLDLFVTELQADAINAGVPGPIGHLFHNRGAAAPGTFDDVTAGAGVALDAVPGPQSGTLAAVARFADLDGDGWPDLVVASDYRESRIFWNDGGTRFVDGTVAAGVGTDEHGMGLATGDVDGDGRPDLFVSGVFAPGVAGATGDRLFRYAGRRRFEDVTDAAGVRDAGWAWGAQAFDVDDDGDLDLVVASGARDDALTRALVQADLGALDLAPFASGRVRLWRNDGQGTFTDVSDAAGLVDVGVGGGVVPVDYDGDGDLDVLVLHDGAPPRLWRNDGGNAGHWLGLALDGVHAQRQGIGAVVTVTPRRGRPLVREMSASATTFAQDGTATLRFGLGAQRAPVRSVRIRWPTGRVQTVKRLAVDAVHRVTEDTACRGKARTQDATCVKAHADAACIVALNRAGAGVAAVAGKRLVRCVDARGDGASVDACVTADADGRLAAAMARGEQVARARCAQAPPFGPTSAAAVSQASAALVRAHDLLGPSLDAALADRRTDPRTARCQRAAVRAIVRLANGELAAFDACKARGLARGAIASTADLGGCVDRLDETTTALRTAVGRRVTRACDAVTLGAAFPGTCGAGDPAGLAGCLAEQTACGLCLALDAADGLGRGCHRFAQGVATTYCGDRPAPAASIARAWDETLLDAIRRDTPRPTVHARNLFHLSAVMWDAWRAYGGGGRAFLTDESHASDDPARDRAVAVSFAAYRLLAERFSSGPGKDPTEAELRRRMYELGLDVAYTTTDGDAPAAVGNRIGAAMIAYGLADGANEQGNYADPDYLPVNQPLLVKQSGTTMADPNRWQPLALDVIVTQNGIPLPDKVQTAIGTRWARVAPFALTRADPNDVYVDPGTPPQLGGTGDAAYKDGARRVLELSSELDAADGATIDISPGAYGNNPLGTNDGTGRATNPSTGQPYASNVVPRGDFLRVLAEFWADGPQSETPPGHWNVIANGVSDALAAHRIGGAGPDRDRLEWDVKLYLALNGAVHDAAIVAWGLKGKYDSVRPISMIRYLAGKGQSTDPGGPSYAPDGLPLVPGFIEVITPETTVPGGRHEGLAGHEGEIAVRAYAGPPPGTPTAPSGVHWIRAVDWMPYQKRTFVTPAFPGYTSGHSTFSRAAAEVLTAFTGDPFFPGGLGSFRAGASRFLQFEPGPTVDVNLQWATYYDAADQAGQSRIAGGIHVPADDFTGRVTGSQIGIDAFAKALTYFASP